MNNRHSKGLFDEGSVFQVVSSRKILSKCLLRLNEIESLLVEVLDLLADLVVRQEALVLRPAGLHKHPVRSLVLHDAS